MELHFVEFRTNFQVFVSSVPCESIENKYLCITILLITHEIWKRYYFQPITMDITIKHLFITAALMLSNNIIAQTPVFLTAGQSNADGREYDNLMGMAVKKPERGVFICCGKKVIL